MAKKNNTKVAVLTGAGRVNSVGAASALTLAKKGYDIVLTCLSSRHQAAEVQKVCKQEGVDAVVYCGDLTRTECCAELASSVKSRWNSLNVLVNCLGVTKDIPYKNLDMIEDEDFSRILAVNAMAPFQIVRAFQKMLTEAKGCVVNISSNAGLSGNGSCVAYAAAKGAENTLTLALAKALSPDIRVNGVCPAFIDSSWWEDSYAGKSEAYQALIKSMSSNNLTGRIIKPDDVAHTVVYLVENPVINGELIRLDGGRHIGRIS